MAKTATKGKKAASKAKAPVKKATTASKISKGSKTKSKAKKNIWGRKLKCLQILSARLFDKSQPCHYWPPISQVAKPEFDKYIEDPKMIVKNMEEYMALPPKVRYSFDICLVDWSCLDMLADQIEHNKNLKWIHSITAGIDGFVGKPIIKNCPLPLTNAKGAFSEVLGEFIALGMLYHTKRVKNFKERQANKLWATEPVALMSKQHMLIVGYGDIGAGCARIAKNGFGMKVTGLKRNPKKISDEHKSYCDDVIGIDQYHKVLPEADFVVSVLPRVVGVTDDFFTMESTFKRMKKSAVFMSIGRGTVVNEDDLVKALKQKKIAGAVMDVYKKEPLSKDSELWDQENMLLLYPHCADQDLDHHRRSLRIFADNLEAFMHEGASGLKNVTDKKAGY